MPQDNCQKIKLLKLMEILRRETDSEHPMPTGVICEKLVALGTTCDRRTLHRDIKLLNEYGYEIMCELINHENCYYIEDRSFSMPELKILIDAVQAAGFVTEKKTAELVEKIASLGGSNRASLLQSNIVNFNTRKHSNETIFYAVDAIEQAIQDKKQISFRYFDLNENREKVFRKDGGTYVTEPVALVYLEDNYYLIAYSEKHGDTANYRVDRMDKVTVLDEKVSRKAVSLRKNVAKLTAEAFKMYGGREEIVTLTFDERLMGTVYDKFGEQTAMKRVGEKTIEASVPVMVSPTFFGWLFQFGSRMRVTAPPAVAEAYERSKTGEITDVIG